MRRITRPALALFVLVCVLASPLRAAERAVTRRTVEEALPWLHAIAGRPFAELIKAYNLSLDIRAKGSAGLLLEELLGMPPDSATKDFLDADIKTNETAPDGTPLETMFITQVSSHVDELLERTPYEETWLATKIARVVYVPVVRQGPPGTWYFLTPYDVSTGPGTPYFEQLRADYRAICRKMIRDVESRGALQTTSGTYFQIRTKDSAPYSPIYSKKYGRQIADKGYAFYFRKEFMNEVRRRERTSAP